MTLTFKTAKHAIDVHGEVFIITDEPDYSIDSSLTRDEAESISRYDPGFKPCIVVTTAREALEAAWELAHPAPKGTIIPAETPLVTRGPEGITFIDEGYNFTTRVNGLGDTECRTLTPLPEPEPEPEPWEESDYCFANGNLYKRLRHVYAPFWRRVGSETTYFKETMTKLDPHPVTIEGDEQ
ncbi:hypothetical protein [Dermabacter hominis]|uniref:hypothetical protein n=1 Tax=Dermabacter hominis TaxID=36740 RepID=UPI002A4B7BB1|nr:hypothetical protein [Dermabacter hominis]